MNNLSFLVVLLGFFTVTNAFKYVEIFSDGFNDTEKKVGTMLSKWDGK
jgi:hypothetical protein